MEGDQAERSACQALNLEGYWHSRRTRITKIMLTLTTWQDDFDQDELRQVFSGMSLLPEFNVEAAKQNLIGIGENLVQMVNITSANSRIGRRLREAGLTLKESVEMAKRSTSDPKNWNAASAISESSMTSNLDPGGDQDPVNILERDTQSLVAMDLAKSLRQKRLSRKHRVNEPTYEFTFDGSMHLKTDQSPHLITAASQAVQRQRITSPDRSRLQKDRVRRSSSHARRKLKTRQPSFHRSHQSPSPPLSRSSTAKDPGCPRSPKKARTGHVVNTQHNHLLVVEAALRSIGRLWLEAKPSSDIDSAINDGSAHLTLLISQDPKPFRMDSLERSGRSLPPEDLTQEAFTESVEDALSEAFRRLQLDDEAVRVAPELLKALRNQISETRGETMKLTPAMDVAIIQDTLSSMDFALSLLHNFPQWSIFTDSQSLAYTKSLCVSVESSLVDEYLNSLMRLFTESQKVLELKPDDPNLARNLLAFLFERARQLKSLDLSSSNSLSWEGLQEPLDDLLLQLESFPGTQAHALSRSSSIPNIEDHVTQMPMDENDQTTDQMSDEMSTNMITVQMYDDDEKTERQSSPVALGSEKIHFQGLSYGTIIGPQYGYYYPDANLSMVLDGNLEHYEDGTS
nr:hypothetical protein FVER53263_01571 [Fusarium verticillioides]